MSILSLVAVVDDDVSVRESLPFLLRECGYEVEAFSSAKDFLVSKNIDEMACLILDVAMPNMTGPELLHELRLGGREIPTIFITADGDKSLRPKLMIQGGVECLFKPFSDTDLLDALDSAIKGS